MHLPLCPADAGAPGPPAGHQPLHNIDPDMEALNPPEPPQPPYQPAPRAHSGAPCGPAPAAREPRAEPAWMAAAPAARGSGEAPAQQAQEPRAEPVRGAEGARRDLRPPRGRGAFPGDGSVSVAELGHLRNHQGAEERALRCRAPPGWGEPGIAPRGSVAREDRKTVLRTLIRAEPRDRGPTWPAFLDGGAVLRVTEAEANNWLPRALRTALGNWRYHPRNPPLPQPQPSRKRRRR